MLRVLWSNKIFKVKIYSVIRMKFYRLIIVIYVFDLCFKNFYVSLGVVGRMVENLLKCWFVWVCLKYYENVVKNVF